VTRALYEYGQDDHRVHAAHDQENERDGVAEQVRAEQADDECEHVERAAVQDLVSMGLGQAALDILKKKILFFNVFYFYLKDVIVYQLTGFAEVGEQGLDKTDAVESAAYCVRKEEERADGAAEFGTERSTYHVLELFIKIDT
jgi:hypothetical protein